MSSLAPREGYVHHPQKGPLHYLHWDGEGPSAHLLHANGFCAGAYDPLIRQMTHRLDIFASDVRGHGNSLAPSEFPIRDWTGFADDLHFMLTRLVKPPVIGIGHSLGAVTTLVAAVRHPELFSCVVLMDPVILPRRFLVLLGLLRLTGLSGRIPLARGARRRRFLFKGKQEALARFTAGHGIFKSWSSEFVNAYIECGLLEVDEETAVLKCDPELEAQIFESIPLDIWHYARKTACPVLAIRGRHSNTFLPDAAARLSRIMPDCELQVVDKAGHFVPMEQAGICTQLTLDFIQRLKIINRM